MAWQMDEHPKKAEAFFGAVEIAGKRCSSRECDGVPVAAMPLRTPEDGSNVVWLCEPHASALMETLGDQPTNPIAAIVPTCGGSSGGPPCGAAATHLAIVGVRGMGLQLVSVCERHVRNYENGSAS